MKESKHIVLRCGQCALLLMATGLHASAPEILSLSSSGLMVWTNPVPGNLGIIERSADLQPNGWLPFHYTRGTRGMLTSNIPINVAAQSFYRLSVLTNIPDSSLVMHLSFDNDLESGLVLDVSGHGNHGMRYSETNWPSAATGPDGSQAGRFTRYDSLFGDYVGVPYSPSLDRLTSGTILVWAYMTTNSYGATALLDAAWNEHGAWVMGRNYAFDTKFTVLGATGSEHVVVYPDYTRNSDTGGWHYYGVTWNGDNFIGYFNGLPISTNTQAGVPELIIGGKHRWIAVGCRHHDGTPEWGDDAFPNNGWMGGWMDDVRIYNRALSSTEILALYGSFDMEPPSTPTNLTARAVSGNQIEVRWPAAGDNFRVRGYRVRRDGKWTGEVKGQMFADGILDANTSYSYTVQALDVGGNVSLESVSESVTTLGPGSGVDAILDELDGEPWVTRVGSWSNRTNANAYAGFLIQDDNSGKGTKSVSFCPRLPEPGIYLVEMWYPRRANGGTNIPVDIIVEQTTSTVFVNQRRGGNQWTPLGQYSLPAGTKTVVRIRNDDPSGFVQADAVRFLK